MITRRAVSSGLVIVGIWMAFIASAFANQDPRVPPDRESGGIPVAIISTGVNYTLPQISSRLARDGEGQIIGWDFADGDHRPFDVSAGKSPPEDGGDGTALASLLLAQSSELRLSPIRFDPQNSASLARALAFAGQTHTRVVVLAVSSGRAEDWDLFKQAAEHFRQLLIVVPRPKAKQSVFPADLGLDNLLTVDSRDDGDASATGFDNGPVTIPSELVAVTRVAAKAAQEAARNPNLDGAALRKLLQPK
jgi:hypothetical protein